jgi:putative ABC transport system permease protein
MNSHYLKIVLRHFAKYRTFSLINVLGLTIGFASCLFIFLYIQDELKYDKHHEHKERIYRICRDYKFANAEGASSSTTPPLASTLKANFPEIEEVVRFSNWDFELNVRYNDRMFIEKNFVVADQEIFKVFTIPMIRGNVDEALTDPFSVVVTEAMAKKYFGTEDPIGKSLFIRDSYHKVTGVVANCPVHSHFQYDFIFPLKLLAQVNHNDWFQHAIVTYVLLKEGQKPSSLEAKLTDFIVKHLAPFVKSERGTIEDYIAEGSFRYRLFLQPLTDIYLDSHIEEPSDAQGSRNSIFVLSVIGLFILLLAAINFTNLSTALSMKRDKELTIRMILGSNRKQLLKQLTFEIFVASTISILAALFIASLILPQFNEFIDKQIEPAALLNIDLMLYCAALLVLTTFFTVIRSSFFYTKQIHLVGLRMDGGSHPKNLRRKNGLIAFQFAICIAIIASTIVVFRQNHFVENKRLGFDKENVIVISPSNVWDNARKALKLEMLEIPGVSHVVNMGESFGNIFNNMGHTIEGGQGGFIYTISADYDFLDAFNIKLKDGRYFDRIRQSDEKGVLLNEASVKMLGITDPIGKRFIREEYFTIIGIVNDFHFNSLYYPINPLIIYLNNEYWGQNIYIKYKTSDLKQTIGKIETVWKKHVPDQPFYYSFLSDNLQKMYAGVEKTEKLLGVFSTLAILIACLGLFGLAAVASEQRTKEIGIRKVNGAKISEILTLLNRDFIKWVAVAFVIATPIAYFAMNKWLENFAYKTELSWWIFALAGLMALGIALLTVSWQSWKAATRNPVEALRYE